MKGVGKRTNQGNRIMYQATQVRDKHLALTLAQVRNSATRFRLVLKGDNLTPQEQKLEAIKAAIRAVYGE